MAAKSSTAEKRGAPALGLSAVEAPDLRHNRYLRGTTIETIKQRIHPAIHSGLKQLKPEEAAVVVLLDRKLHVSAPSRRKKQPRTRTQRARSKPRPPSSKRHGVAALSR